MDHLSEQIRVALATADDPRLPVADRAEMLMDIAVAIQQRPASIDHLRAAIALYDRAHALCPPSGRLMRARIAARRATAFQAIPGDDAALLADARDAYQQAIPVFAELGSPEEVAEAELNHGLVLQALAGCGQARISDAIAAYQRALGTFDRARFPREFAILQNNLATAFLAIPLTDERARLREALAVQAFEEALQIVSLIDHPIEYAMLQNNLGNALQYASSSHALENNLRALEAYDEALKVRTRDTMPLAYANTIANKANCLWNLPDDLDPAPHDSHAHVDAPGAREPAVDWAGPARGGRRLHQARAYYSEAREIFAAHGEPEKARAVGRSCDQIDRELLAAAPAVVSHAERAP
jgi:tetratricopeptide (TPR) repeat protein